MELSTTIHLVDGGPIVRGGPGMDASAEHFYEQQKWDQFRQGMQRIQQLQQDMMFDQMR